MKIIAILAFTTFSLISFANQNPKDQPLKEGFVCEAFRFANRRHYPETKWGDRIYFNADRTGVRDLKHGAPNDLDECEKLQGQEALDHAKYACFPVPVGIPDVIKCSRKKWGEAWNEGRPIDEDLVYIWRTGLDVEVSGHGVLFNCTHLQ